MAKKPTSPKRHADRLKIDIPWEQAAAKLARTPASAIPPRQVKIRKTAKKRP